MNTVKQKLLDGINSIDESLNDVDFLNEVMNVYASVHPFKHNPVTKVKYIPIKKIRANDYNPNHVPRQEMDLLHTSIEHDGYTQPTVAFYDKEKDKYIIVDGFHRYTVCARYKDINELNHGYLPIVVIEKSLADRMASTVRHNRARGKHAVEGMSNIVLQMLKEGMSDAEVCMELGLEVDELIKLKHITGFAKLFEGAKYSDSWESNKQILNRKKVEEQMEEAEKHKEEIEGEGE